MLIKNYNYSYMYTKYAHKCIYFTYKIYIIFNSFSHYFIYFIKLHLISWNISVCEYLQCS